MTLVRQELYELFYARSLAPARVRPRGAGPDIPGDLGRTPCHNWMSYSILNPAPIVGFDTRPKLWRRPTSVGQNEFRGSASIPAGCGSLGCFFVLGNGYMHPEQLYWTIWLTLSIPSSASSREGGRCRLSEMAQKATAVCAGVDEMAAASRTPCSRRCRFIEDRKHGKFRQ